MIQFLRQVMCSQSMSKQFQMHIRTAATSKPLVLPENVKSSVVGISILRFLTQRMSHTSFVFLRLSLIIDLLIDHQLCLDSPEPCVSDFSSHTRALKGMIPMLTDCNPTRFPSKYCTSYVTWGVNLVSAFLTRYVNSTTVVKFLNLMSTLFF